MEGTGNGPNELPNVPVGESRAYWYNTVPTGATLAPNPFVYTLLPAPHATVSGVTSLHGAYTGCTLTTQYAYCTEGVDLYQAPVDGGVLPADAGPEASVPQTTVLSDISQYTGLTFWAMSGVDGGTVSVHTEISDIDTDTRGGKCGLGAPGAAGYYQCSDDFQHTDTYGPTWTQYTISLVGCSTGAATCDLSQRSFGVVPSGVFDPQHVYGIKWQADGSQLVDAAPVVTAYWVDDLYFTQ
jgi:hypothetical protein